MRTIPLTFIFFALLGFPALARAQSGTATKVTITARRITLDALVRMLAKQSGLTLEVDPADPLSATPLMAYLTGVRADAAASALADLLSARRAAWQWERLTDKPNASVRDENAVSPTDFKPGIAYRLRPSSGAKGYAAKARARIWQDIAGIVAASGGAAGTPEELAALAQSFQEAAKDAPPPFVPGQTFSKEQAAKMETWFEKRQQSNQRLAQAAFARLAPADRERLISGREVRLGAERFDPAFADAVREAGESEAGSTVTYFVASRGEVRQVTPDITDPPTYAVYFDTNRTAFTVAPSLTVSVERTIVYHDPNGPYGGSGGSRSGLQSLGGAADVRWRGVLTKEWTPDPPPTTAPIPDTMPLPEMGARPQGNTDDPNDEYASYNGPLSRLRGMATQSGKRLNVLARLATFTGGASDPFTDENAKTFGAARKALLTQRAMPTRWFVPPGAAASEGILLANSLEWIWMTGPDKLVAPQYRADFAAARQRDPDHLITLDMLCDAARKMGPDALYSLPPPPLYLRVFAEIGQGFKVAEVPGKGGQVKARRFIFRLTKENSVVTSAEWEAW